MRSNAATIRAWPLPITGTPQSSRCRGRWRARSRSNLPATTCPLGGPISTSRCPGVSICPHLPIITGTSRQTCPLAWSGPSPARRHRAQIAQVALHGGQAALGEQALERRGAAELAVAAPAQDLTLREGLGALGAEAVLVVRRPNR